MNTAKPYSAEIASLIGKFGVTEDDREIWLTRVPVESHWRTSRGPSHSAAIKRELHERI